MRGYRMMLVIKRFVFIGSSRGQPRRSFVGCSSMLVLGPSFAAALRAANMDRRADGHRK
jgi:hypothetical protein